MRSTSPALALACLALCACSTPDQGAYEAHVRSFVSDGMPVGDALLALQVKGYQCASTWDADRTIACTRHQAHLTTTCIERVGFVAPAKDNLVTGLTIPPLACSRDTA
jgi:hypothetical protein